MKETVKNRVKGKAEEIGGTLQQNLGQLVGDEEMEARGAAHVVQGEARQAAAKAVEQAQGAVDEAVGTVKETLGGLVGNQRLQIEGTVQRIGGKMRKDVSE